MLLLPQLPHGISHSRCGVRNFAPASKAHLSKDTMETSGYQSPVFLTQGDLAWKIAVVMGNADQALAYEAERWRAGPRSQCRRQRDGSRCPLYDSRFTSRQRIYQYGSLSTLAATWHFVPNRNSQDADKVS